MGAIKRASPEEVGYGHIKLVVSALQIGCRERIGLGSRQPQLHTNPSPAISESVEIEASNNQPTDLHQQDSGDEMPLVALVMVPSLWCCPEGSVIIFVPLLCC